MTRQGGLQKRHVVTVVVCDVSESTHLAETLELEDYSALLQEMRAQAETIISGYGGSLIRIDGDGMIVIFGYPESHEDAPKRAIQASLDLHAWAAGYPVGRREPQTPLRLHTGIHSGVVLLRAGDLSLGRYEILGDTTNLASRLCGYAGAGEIVVSCDALGADRYYFDTTEPELIKIRSRQKKLLVCRVLGRHDRAVHAAPNLRHDTIPLVARAHELEWLTRFVQLETPEHVAVIQAEAGMGKSRLLSEVLVRCKALGCSAHWSYCSSYLGGSQLDPVWQLGRSLLQTLAGAGDDAGQVPADWRREIEAFGGLFRADGLARRDMEPAELAQSFASAIRLISQHYKSVLLVLDDWHWADDASRLFCDLLIREHLEGLLIVVAERSDRSPPRMGETVAKLELGPLCATDAAKLIERIDPTLDALIVREIHAQSGGNPLYIEELSHAARSAGPASLTTHADAWLETLIQARVSNLAPRQREVLEIASVIGRVVPNWLLQDVSETEDLAGVLEALRANDFLYPDEHREHSRFKHGFTRDAVYGLISAANRKAYNSKVAEIISARASDKSAIADPGELARYYLESGETRRGIEYSIEAGNAALSTVALDKAQYHFQTALEHLYEIEPEDEEIVFLVRRYGQSCIVDPSWNMVDVLEPLIARAKQAGHEASAVWAEYYLAFVKYGIGSLEEAIAHYDAVVAAARELGNESLIRRVEASLGQVYAAACRSGQALEALDRSIAIQRAQLPDSRSPAALAYSLATKGHTLMDMGQVTAAFASLNEATELVQGFRMEASMSILSYSGAALILAGRFEDAQETLASIYAMAEQMRSRFHLAQSSTFLGMARFFLTRDEDVLRKIEVSADQWAQKSFLHISIVYGMLAEAYAGCGSRPQAEDFAGKALCRAAAGDRFGETMACRAQASCAAQDGDMNAARQYLDAALRASSARGSRRDELLTRYFARTHLGIDAPASDAELAAMGIDPAVFFPEAPSPCLAEPSLRFQR
ncbi:MAG: AAA family ATPase [Hyphomonas sp.]|nr:AAA family ATPase [Hyphomonas sp.]